jgi:hypothetical protein
MFTVALVPIAISIYPTIEGRRLDDSCPDGKEWRDDDGFPNWKRRQDDDSCPDG